MSCLASYAPSLGLPQRIGIERRRCWYLICAVAHHVKFEFSNPSRARLARRVPSPSLSLSLVRLRFISSEIGALSGRAVPTYAYAWCAGDQQMQSLRGMRAGGVRVRGMAGFY